MSLDAAPNGPFGRDQRGIGVDLQRRDAEPVQMSVPRRSISEDAIGMLGEAGDDGPGERAGAHIGESFFIDDVIVMSGARQFEEVEPALGSRGPEPSEIGVADLGAETVLALVASPGVVGRYPTRV